MSSHAGAWELEKAYRKFVERNANLQERIENTLEQMEQDVFATHLNTHKLSGKLSELRACSCGYDCRIVFLLKRTRKVEKKWFFY